MSRTQEGSTPDDYFIPLDHNDPLDCPDSVTGDDQQDLSNHPSLSLKPVRFLQRTLWGIGALLTLFTVWQSISFFTFLLNSHWLLAAFFSVLCLGLLGMIGKTALDFFRYQQDFRDIDQLQTSAEALTHERTVQQGKLWLKQLKALYQGKPQQEILEQALTTLPDYVDDSEIMLHLDRHLFQVLDQQAMTCVSKHSQQTALMVALSPISFIDMLLSLWRCLRMMDELCQIYGIRPSLPARTRLLKMVFTHMAMTGATDLISGQLADFASNKLIGTISTQAASGVGVGLYTARIGFQVMDICRPLPFQPDQKPSIRKIASVLYQRIRRQFKGA